MIKYYVKIKDRYAKEGTEPIPLEFDSLDDVMNIISLVAYGQPEYHHIDITVYAEKKESKESEE